MYRNCEHTLNTVMCYNMLIVSTSTSANIIKSSGGSSSSNVPRTILLVPSKNPTNNVHSVLVSTSLTNKYHDFTLRGYCCHYFGFKFSEEARRSELNVFCNTHCPLNLATQMIDLDVNNIIIIIVYWHTPQATRAQTCGSSMTASTVTGSP